MILYDVPCVRCGQMFKRNGMSDKYCAACRPIAYEEKRQARERRRRERLETQRLAERERRIEYDDQDEA